MDFKAFHTLNRVNGRTVTGIASVFGNIDSYNDRILPGAFRKTIAESLRRVKFLWQHDFSAPPVARIDSLREIGVDELPEELRAQGAVGGLEVTRTYLETERGEEILTAIREGAITEMSIGITPIKADFAEEKHGGEKVMVRNIREARLWDVSDVVWGANELTVATKAVVPYRDTGKADLNTAWEAPALSDFTDEARFEDLDDAEKRRIMEHFAWSRSIPPGKFEDLKLPHHKPSRDGIGAAVWNGVRAAMGALMGARGGVDIPGEDIEGVYKHLARHYEEFGKEPPELKRVMLGYWIGKNADVFVGEYAEALDALMKQLRAEPSSDLTLTHELMLKISILEKEVEVL